MKELSIFIDESGDFGEVKERPSYYLVTLVFHEQNNDISEQVKRLEDSIRSAGFNLEYIHTGPAIRREEVFSSFSIDQRRKLIFKLLNFVNGCPITCETIAVNRKEAVDKEALTERLEKEISKLITKNQEYLNDFDRLIIYYDNGQTELSSILNAIFLQHFVDVEFRKAEPQKYRLLQIADFVCSIDLLRIKKQENRLSKSEQKFFYKSQELKKTFFKAIDKKRLH